MTLLRCTLLLALALAATVTALADDARLPQMDLTAVKARVMKEHQWTQERADQAEHEYRRFWLVHKRHATLAIVPTPDVDEIWHAHILFTHEYVQACQRYFGHYFHHNPVQEPVTAEHSAAAIQETHRAFQAVFGDSVVNTKMSCSGGNMSCSGGNMSCSGSCSGGMPMNCNGMGMGFHWGTNEMVLWDSWHTDTRARYAGTLIFLVVLMIAKEFLFATRQRLVRQQRARISSKTPLLTGETGYRSVGFASTIRIRFVNAILGAINLILGYFVMLIVMTYNNGFFIAVVLGAAIGLFFFSVPFGVESSSNDELTGVEADVVEHDCCEK